MKFNLNMDKFPFGVNVSGLIRSEKGLGTAVRSDIEALKTARIPYILNNITDLGSANVDKTFNDFSGENNYLFNLIHVNPDVFVNFANEANRPYFEGHCNIGYWVWELDIFPEEWVRLADYLDEIWTPSDFSFQAISKAILKTDCFAYARNDIPVTKIPHCISLSPDNIPIGKEAARRGLNIAADIFMFLFIFDFQSEIERKNPFAVVEAFKKAFSPTDKAMLFLKTSHSEFNKKEFYRLLNAVKGYNITIADSVFTKEQIYSLMNACDCYVSLHRSEGFGLTAAEAMALGKPVIATGYSGNMDFMNQDDGFPVSYRLVEVNGDYGAYKKGNMWAEPDIDESADYMRRVFDNRGEAETVGIKGREFIKKYYCPEAISEKYKGRLNRIIGGYEDRLKYRPAQDGDGSKIKIGWLSSWNTKCGIATHSKFLTENFNEKDFKIYYFANKVNSDAVIKKDGSNVFRIWNDSGDKSLDLVVQEIFNNKIDVVIIQFHPAFFNILEISDFINEIKKHNIKIIADLHVVGDIGGAGAAIKSSLGFIVNELKKIDVLMVHNDDDLSILKELGLTSNIILFPPGVKKTEFEEKLSDDLRHKMGFEDKRIISSFGFLMPHKGILELISAFSKLKEEHKDLHLLLINSLQPNNKTFEDYYDKCASKILELGLERNTTFITDYLTDDESLKLLSLSDMVVYPYQHTMESASGAVRYGLSAGRTVLCTPLNIFKEVGGMVSFLPGTNIESIYKGISFFIEHPKELAKSKTLQQKWVDEHDWKKLSIKLQNIIKKIAET